MDINIFFGDSAMFGAEVLHELKHIQQNLHGHGLLLADIVDRLEKLKGQTMSLADDLKAGMAKIDAETNAVGQRIADLSARITNGMSDEEVAAVKAAMTAESDRLHTLAQDPNAPVPPAPPQLQAARKK